ncbi:PspA/IM30 family protein [Aquisphaera insulae]|uniref:PspA/IM30 family protein n=1 Tax=Aquisphaera insulae TaxID=2712864 RepID=UPI0013EC65A1|nr:PspA/IM30 family protein [Aquisphaera insulae]
MILGKLWRAFRAQLHKLAGSFWEPDPIAVMQLEYDRAVAQLREGREGLADYRALVERVARQVARNVANVERLDATVRTCLDAGDRETAGRYVLELQRARRDLADNQGQLQLHETAYENNLLKIKQAGKKLSEIRTKIARYDSELRMSAAEAEMARLAQEFHVDATTDFGRLESEIQDKIDLNRAKVKVAADLSNVGVAEIRQEIAGNDQLAEDALREFEGQVARESDPSMRSLAQPSRGRLSQVD